MGWMSYANKKEYWKELEMEHINEKEVLKRKKALWDYMYAKIRLAQAREHYTLSFKKEELDLLVEEMPKCPLGHE